MPDAITIRPAATVADYLACQEAQRQAWGITDDSYVVPLATLVGAQLHGGLVLGAFRRDGSAVGLSFAFLGKVDGRPCLYSQLTGIIPSHQGQGLGFQFKFAQREFCQRERIDRVAWSFDPLQSKNAHFNIRRLGAVGTRFIEDMYGRRTDALNLGTPTDRLIVEWSTNLDLANIATVLLAECVEYPHLIEVQSRPDGAVEPARVNPAAIGGATPALLQIPSNISTIRRDDPPRAEAWNLAIRQAFDHVFAAGRIADGFLRDESPSRRCYYYVVRPRTTGSESMG